MGFKITHRVVNDMNFMGAVNHLCQQKLEAKVAWNLARTKKKLEKIISEAREVYLGVIKKYAEVDEKGNPKFQMTEEKKDAEGKVIESARAIPGAFIWKEGGKEAHDKEFNEFMEVEVEINSFLLKPEDITIPVEADLLAALEPIMQTNMEIVK